MVTVAQLPTLDEWQPAVNPIGPIGSRSSKRFFATTEKPTLDFYIFIGFSIFSMCLSFCLSFSLSSISSNQTCDKLNKTVSDGWEIRFDADSIGAHLSVINLVC